MNNGKPELSKNMTKFRNEKRMSKQDLALTSGVSRPSISQYESGRRRPKSEAIHKIAAALGVTPAKLDPYGHGESQRCNSVNEGALKYQSKDIYDFLADWLRAEAPAEKKKAILMTAQAMGFQNRALTCAIDALCEPARSRAG